MIDSAAFQGKKAAYFTLGCKLNFSETSTFGRMLQEMGVTTVGRDEQADICIINTCSVTDVADAKCRQAIHRMVRNHPNAFIVVTGCYAQLSADEVSKIPGVDLVLGSDEKAQLVQFLSEAWSEEGQRDSVKGHAAVQEQQAAFKSADARSRVQGQRDTVKGHAAVQEQQAAFKSADTRSKNGERAKVFRKEKTKDIQSFAPSCSRGNRTRFFLKVQDGCSYFCTYCTIPYARGFSRNPTISSLVQQAEQAVREGGKEIVLTGVNIGDFGRSTGERFIDLVKALDQVEGVERYRISSLEPDLIDDELIAYCAQSRAFMPHFHIPLQSGSDAVLKLMHRRYDTALFAHKIEKIKEMMPDAFIGVDVMVGTRGELDEYFEECYAFLDRLPVTQLHVFPYSERPGTAALRIPHVVSAADKKLRSKRLLELSDKKTEAFYASYIGKEAEVLFEKASRGRAMHGFTRNYIRVELPPAEGNNALDNQIVQVTLGDFNHDRTALKALISDK
ncbi:MAG: tRNA (N(6)-L-threonylcarbamoyladenosine(37)-C(2))-methylthiotransferase MtaB [Prevotella sp.]|nr:tRNA (N(6)-L-threonylcarbamoyladenosine(37)-C(2))-methylthiotransferase MtaB [Prevotella sp.]